jgi:uncharacterized protein (TIGR00730 family)
MNEMNRNFPTRKPTICVFCGSSHGALPLYTEIARNFGKHMTEAGFDLVFGGGGIGLMGEVASTVSQAGGRVLGVIPSFLRHLEPPLGISTELVITETMNERKAVMFDAADSFAVLPGGLGTLDEFSEAVTYAQLRQHAKPIVLVNANGFFDPLLGFLNHIVAEGFAQPETKALYRVAPTVEDAIAFLAAELNKVQAGAPSR